MDLNKYIGTIMDFPKKGIAFKDISPLLANPEIFEEIISKISKNFDFNKIDKIAGLDARGFLFGTALALKTKKPFIMIRKKGKLPGRTISEEYGLEYGKDKIEIQEDAIKKGENILLIDDLLATGGTIKAATKLIERLNGNIIGIQFIIELKKLKGRDELKYNINSLIKY